MKTINIKGKEYITVHERLKYFNENYPNGMITTERTVEYDKEAKEELTEGDKITVKAVQYGKVEIVKAIVTPDVSNPNRYFTGYSQASWSDTNLVNKTSALENAETSAIGRALGFMGIGLDNGVASADEVVKAKNAGGEQIDYPLPF